MPPPKLTTWPRDAEQQPFDAASWNRWINFANGQLSAPQVWAQDSGVPGLTWAPQTPRLTVAAPLTASGTVAISGPSLSVAAGTTTTIAGPLTASGTVAITGPLTVSNTAQFSGAVTMTSAGSLTAAGPVSITGPSFAVTPLGTFAGGVTISAGALTFTGTTPRILGNFNAPIADRPMFQTTTVNGNTPIAAIPNGTGAGAAWYAHVSSNTAASARLGLVAGAASSLLLCDAYGGAALQPLTIQVGGLAGMTFAANGDIVLGSGTGIRHGFFGATGTAKPTVGDSRGGNLALLSLLTALSGLGLITNATTA